MSTAITFSRQNNAVSRASTTKGLFPMTRFWLRKLTHVNFKHVNKIEARYKVLRLNVKLSEVLLLRLRATFHTLPLFYLRT